MTKDTSIVEYMSQESVKTNIQETLGKKTPQFIASVASLYNSNETLLKCDKKSVMLACLTAASLDLPINQSLGFAFIIPYKQKNGTYAATFQAGYKAFIQLAMRSGQFKTLNVSDVREGEITGENRLTGEIEFKWAEKDRSKLPIIGYVGYFKLINGFEKSMYITADELKKHGMRFSQTMKKGYGLWVEDFDAMASKTVIKMLLSKYAPLTVDMQKMQLADQAVVTETGYDYVDNQPVDAKEVAAEKEKERILKHIEEAKTADELKACEEYLPDDEAMQLYLKKMETLKPAVKKEVK